MNINIEAEKNLFTSIDLFKFIMAVCVIAIHTHALSDYSDLLMVRVLNTVIWSSVPFFFMTSGFFLYKKTYSCPKNEALKRILYSTKKYVIYYIISSIIYLPLSCKAYVGMEPGKALFLYLRNFLFVGQHRDDWFMWYLLSSIYAFAALYIIVRNQLSPYEIVMLILIIMLVSFGLDILINSDITSLSANYSVTYNILQNTTQGGRVLRGIFFIPIGWLYAGHDRIWGGHTKFRYGILIISAWIAVVTETYIIKNLFLSVFAIILFSIIVNLHIKCITLRVSLVLRNMSKIIYFSHMYVFAILSQLLWGERKYGLESFAVVTFIVCLIAFIVIVFVSPRIKQLIYEKRR